MSVAVSHALSVELVQQQQLERPKIETATAGEPERMAKDGWLRNDREWLGNFMLICVDDAILCLP